ncbi:PRC and DUF2382 domain-containing protein [Nocardioides sp. URHA0020]|uniref:PRC and DUF2382 domain-containing protein n=1 Tax=Nocardioides sp. URHA0020 TaxID=1380392 RepID=UPI001E45DB8F|nr:PRC and DUF2382 domain-containing protein [Nocardioides sp. URHA0020]
MIGNTAYGSDGSKIGKVGQLYLDDQTGQPEFITVNTGLFGKSETFVPVENASMDGDRVVLPYSKDKIKDAPSVDLDGDHLDEAEERRLYGYYGRSYDAGAGDDRHGRDDGEDSSAAGRESFADASVGHDTSGPETDDAMTRSEERLDVSTTTQEAGRARLRKYVTTEMETQTVPVRKERAVLEREPVTDANVDRATDGPAISEEEHEVVLHEERPVVDTTVEPVERVRLSTEAATEEQQVSEEVRKEHVEAEGDVQNRR